MSEGYDGLPAYYSQSSDPLTPNYGFSLKGMDPILAENWVIADTAIKSGGGGGTPGGSPTNIQYNLAGAFSGIANSSVTPGGAVAITDNTAYSVAGKVNGMVGAFLELFDLGITAPSPVAPSGLSQLDVACTFTSIIPQDQINYAALSVGAQVAPTGNAPVGSYVGSEHTLFVPASNTFSINQVQGIITSVINQGSGSVNMAALSAWSIQNNAAADSVAVIALDGEAYNYAGVVSEEQEALFAYSDCYGGQVVNNYTIFIEGVAPSGLISNNYALYIADPTGTANIVYALTAVANHSGNNTTYTATIPANVNLAGLSIVIAGFTNSSNNGTFTVVSNTATSLVVNNGAGVAETHAGTATTTANPNPWALFVQAGKSSFGGPVLLNKTLVDGTGSVGTSGQVLSSTVTGTQWITVSSTPPWSSLTNAVANLTLNNAGFSTTFNQTSPVPWTWANTTAGTALSQNASPVFQLEANYFSGSVSQPDTWSMGSVLGQGVNGSSLLEILHSGTTGLAGVLIGNSQFTTSIESSPYFILGGSYEVSASLGTFAEDNWYIQNVIGAGANGSSLLTFSHAGTEGTIGLAIVNASLATSTQAQSSPLLEFNGQFWNGSISALDSWTINNSLTNGTNGASTLTIAHSGSTGSATVSVPILNVGTGSAAAPSLFWGTNLIGLYGSAGALRLANGSSNVLILNAAGTGVNSGVKILAGAGFNFCSSFGDCTQTADTGLQRFNQADVIAAGNGVLADYSGTLLATNHAGNLLGSVQISPISTPATPVVTKVGAGTGATWGYAIVAVDINGNTASSGSGTVINSTTVTPASRNTINTLPSVKGAVSYNIYRTSVGTTPNTTGLLMSLTAAQYSFLLQAPTGIQDPGQCTVTSVATSSGGVAVYSGTFTGSSSNQYVGMSFIVAGFVGANNNGTFVCTASANSTLTLANASATAETHAATATSQADGTIVPSVNTTGTLTVPNTIVQNNTASGTALSTNASPLHLFEANYYSGSLSETDTWSIGSVLGQGVNGSSLLEVLHSGAPSQQAGVLIGNSQFTTAALNSPYLILAGSYEVSGSAGVFAEDNWYLQNVIGFGSLANGTSTLVISHQGTNGFAAVSVPALILNGILEDHTNSPGMNGQVLTSTGTGVAWSSFSVPSTTPQSGDILRYNQWGDNKWDLASAFPIVIGWRSDGHSTGPSTIGTVYTTYSAAGTPTAVLPTATEPSAISMATSGTAQTTTNGWCEGNTTWTFGTFYRMSARIKANQLTNVRYWVGISNGLPVGASTFASDTPATTAFAAFRYSSTTDTTWKALVSNATLTTTVDTGVVVSTAASHVFDVAYDGTNVNFFIDGVRVAQISTNVPATSTTMSMIAFVDNKNTANTDSISMNWMYNTLK